MKINHLLENIDYKNLTKGIASPGFRITIKNLKDKNYLGVINCIANYDSMYLDSEIKILNTLVNSNKRKIIESLITYIRNGDPDIDCESDDNYGYTVISFVDGLRGVGIDWPELDVIDKSFEQFI